MVTTFIRRPVLSIVIALFILILGGIALLQLPMTQFPNVAPPEVNVTVEYTGANAETVIKAAVVPLERAINGVPGMKYIASGASNDGVGVVRIIFETGVDPDVASINVQNRVTKVTEELPPEVIKNGVKIAKEENSMLMYLDIFSSDTTLKEQFLYNFADINVLTELKRIKGVGFAEIAGAKEYAMRIWLNPEKMLAYDISADEVIATLKAENVEAAPGKIGENSEKTSQPLQYILKYTGRYNTAQEYENIAIKSTNEGRILRIKDVATVEFGSTDYNVEAKYNGSPSAALLLKQAPGANANEVIRNIKQRMEEIKASSFINGMDYAISYDVSRFLEASINEVLKTFIEAFLLVSLVVFIFIQDFRSTLIPLLAVPVSLIGTFIFMTIFGFSLNLITLFALVLAIGIVVDNAIVVVEAVHVKMYENKNISIREATELAMKELSGAIIAITLVMASVFIPVSFLSGPTGIFYRQFSLTMAFAIFLSGLTALTLTPALCPLILKKSHKNANKKSILEIFFNSFNKRYDNMSFVYQKIVSHIASRRVITIVIILLFYSGILIYSKIIPVGFIPNEDQGTFYISTVSPAGATLERTKTVVKNIVNSCSDIEAIESISSLSGKNLLTDGTGASFGTCVINLKGWKERKESINEVIDLVQQRIRHIKDAKIEIIPPPPIPGYGNASGFELRLLDKTGSGDYKNMEKITKFFMDELMKRPEIGNVFTVFDSNFPQYLIHIDHDKAAKKGVSTENIMETLQTLFGGNYATNFIKFGQIYKVMVQAHPQNRSKPEDILKTHVKNKEGDIVNLASIVTLERIYGLEQITRYNSYLSAEINGEPSEGYSSGSALIAIQEVAKNKLPRGYDISWAGMSLDEVSAGNEATYIIIISLIFVYLLLSAQYESFVLPISVILSLPIGILGAFMLLDLLGLENNIYTQISIIMLMGLLGKNAILIVEFASIKHKNGDSPLKAAVEGAIARLRPIIMTSFAFIAGLIPLMFATGAGAVGNQTIGSAAIGGMLFGTLFGVIIVPGLYVIFASISEKFTSKDDEQLPLTEEEI